MSTRDEYNVTNLLFIYWQFFEDNYEVWKANKGSSPWKVFYKKDIFENFIKQQQFLEKYLWTNLFLVKLQTSSLLFHSYVSRILPRFPEHLFASRATSEATFDF